MANIAFINGQVITVNAEDFQSRLRLKSTLHKHNKDYR